MATLREWMRRLWGTFRRYPSDPDLERELAFHLELAEEDLRSQGRSPKEAARLARVQFGGTMQAMETVREQRGFPWLSSCWLDVKLGLRMLRKSWGLTLVGGLAMTVAIAAGAVVFAVTDVFFWAALPLDEGDRVVVLQTWDGRASRRRNTSRLDYERWRDTLRSVEEVGAFQVDERNLVTADGPTEPVSIAEMTASGFQVARVPPLLGRPIVEEDERDGADPVVVIGHDVWQSRFLADPAVVGQTVRLGDRVHTVVGVMPEGFRFPVNHRFWTPLRPDPSDQVRSDGPFGAVFARLAPGATLEGAQAELTTLGLLAVPETDQELEPRVVPYTFAFTGDFDRGEVRWMIRVILMLGALLLLPPCANLAILIYARTVTRQEEFAARYALGASRGRIVGQLFIEVLVLAAVAAGAALVITRLALVQVQAILGEDLVDGPPFWMDFTLSFTTILFAAGLGVLAATVAGLVPALKATGGQMQSGLRALGSRSGMQLGATWTVLVVAQIAFSLAALPAAVEMAWGTLRPGIVGPGFAADEYLTARLGADRDMLAGTQADGDQRPFAERFGALQTELVRQLRAEPGVLDVSVAAAAPGQETWADVEVDGVAVPDDGIFEGNNLVRFNQVDDRFFDLFDAPLLTGRGFDAGDLAPSRDAVIVDRAFAELLIGDSNPLGRRVRYLRRRGAASAAADPERWFEVVGVVENVRASSIQGTMYHPLPPGRAHPASLTIRMASTPAIVAARLRELTTALDPTLRVEALLTLGDIYREQAVGNNLGASALAAVTLSVLLLSAAGMYALMSFTVNQRRREIGIRSALGAQPRRLLAGIFRRALRQLAIGAAVGLLVALLVDYYLPLEQAGGWNVPGIVPGAAVFMMVMGLLATTGPARRGLRVDPTEALRDG